jgi:c(7)-type cytochrome triheme protein
MRSAINIWSMRSKANLPRIAMLAIGLFAFGCGSSGPSENSVAVSDQETPIADTANPNPNAELVENIDYSKFGHSTSAHAQLPCLLCHRREDDSTLLNFPGKSGHLPCAGCHVEQFASPAPNPASAMCTICHTDAQTGAMKTFPTLQSFRTKFDHGKHLRIANCTTCHSPSRGGVAISIPIKAAAHATCFQCHTAQEPIGSCNTCHTEGRPIRKSEWAKSYSRGFSHREHMGKRGITCNSCHTVMAGSARTGQVTSPQLAMHFPAGRAVSCATCHNEKRAFGGENFANCKRCHEGQSFGAP